MDKKEGDRKIAVYDLGGGTFDVPSSRFAEVDKNTSSKCSHERRHLPRREDFDQRLMD